MKLKRWIFLMKRTQQVFVPFDAEVGMQSTLHQNSGTAKRNRLIDLLADFFECANVSIRRARPAIERTERANHAADAGVINIAVDDVSADVVGVSARANFGGGHADTGDVVRLEQRGAVRRR